MLTIHVEGVKGTLVEIMCEENTVTLDDLYCRVQEVLSASKRDFYFVYNGKKIQDNVNLCDGVVRVVPRLLGGKGGFGSMLRAIGAQIEKTTNREACRDLSGRRLRDINEEQRLKNWISKKADRERDAIERKKKKIEKLRSEPKVEFSDKKYEEVRSKLSDVVHDAVEKGLQASTSHPSSSTTSKKPERKRGFMLEEEEFSDSSISSSDDQSESDGIKRKIESESDSDEPSPAKKPHLDIVKQNTNAPSTSASESDTEEKPEKNNAVQ